MAKWVDIGSSQEFEPGSKQCVTAGECELVVCNIDDKLAAIENVCPHAGLPMHEGELRGRVLVCPHHGYAYNVMTGRNADYPNEELPAKTFAVRRTDDGRVEVEIPGD